MMPKFWPVTEEEADEFCRMVAEYDAELLRRGDLTLEELQLEVTRYAWKLIGYDVESTEEASRLLAYDPKLQELHAGARATLGIYSNPVMCI